MKVVRSSELRVSILDIEPAQFALLVDAVAELNRADNPVGPFSAEFQRFVDRVTFELAAGAGLFRVSRVAEAVSPVFHLVPRDGPFL